MDKKIKDIITKLQTLDYKEFPLNRVNFLKSGEFEGEGLNEKYSELVEFQIRAKTEITPKDEFIKMMENVRTGIADKLSDISYVNIRKPVNIGIDVKKKQIKIQRVIRKTESLEKNGKSQLEVGLTKTYEMEYFHRMFVVRNILLDVLIEVTDN